jgi:hypothetical protein
MPAAAGLMSVLGIVSETGPHFPPGRSIDSRHVLTNGVGAACGVAAELPIRPPSFLR